METIALRMGPVPISHIFGRHAINIHRNLLGAAIGLGYYEHTICRFGAPQVPATFSGSNIDIHSALGVLAETFTLNVIIPR